MLEWINQNSDALFVATSLGTLLVWVVYLQLFFVQYRRQITPSIIIARGGGTSLKSRCLLSNMSSEAIHIQALVATLHGDGGIITRAVTERSEFGDEEAESGADMGVPTLRGPLASGQMTDVGTFASLLDGVGGDSQERGGEKQVEVPSLMEIQVVAVYGSQDLLVGAKRTFRLERKNNRICIYPQTVQTEQIRSRRERRRLERLLEE